MLFSYRAKSNNGEILEGTLNATDRFSLARELKSRGYIPLSVSEKRDNFFC